jgi:hypothetical protein
MVLSEPPDHVNLEGIKNLCKGYHTYIELKQDTIGYDGWVKDVVIAINGATKPKIDQLEREMSQYLFHTSYKSYHLDLPVDALAQSFPDNNLNYQISAGEIRKWFLIDQEEFFQNTDSSTLLTLSNILSNSNQGIFYSAKPGFVLWLIPVNSEISNKMEEIRQFALDADLILGAISSRGNIAIIGRERDAGINDLPPLRTETILQLAAANEYQLAQSYERTNLFAGKLPGGKDWAPIYLSNELLNTEYGSLLNITDQMLKSWSMNGRIEYENFHHPKPSFFTFSDGVMNELNANTLTFNWNTKGATYSINTGEYIIVALNRTGSLPVTYIPENMPNLLTESVRGCEVDAYNYFSCLNNSNLIRVVQYASLYQIFKLFQIRASVPFSLPNKKPTDILEKQAFVLLKSIQKYDNAALDRMIEKNNHYADNLCSMKMTVSLIDKELGEDGLRRMAAIIANPRQNREKDTVLVSLTFNFIKNTEYIKFFQQFFGFDLLSVKNKYVNSFKGAGGNWIKTPSIALSWDTRDSVRSVGGHNISSSIVPFKIENSLPSGDIKIIKVDGVKTILMNEKDIDRISPQVLRTVEEENSLGQKTFRFDNLITRTRENVIPSWQREARGLSPKQIQVTRLQRGYSIDGIEVNTCHDLIDRLTTHTRENGKGHIEIRFRNFTADEAKVTIKSTEIKLSADNIILKKGDTFDINRSVYDFARANTLIEPNGEIIIRIPAKKISQNNATFIIKGITEKLRNRIKEINKQLFKRAEFENIDFFRELKQELKRNNIDLNDSNVKMEILDSVIAEIMNLGLYAIYS